MIIVDSREKKWEHIRVIFDDLGVPYVFPEKLKYGDYYNTDFKYVVVDRKANLQEVCSNLSIGKNNYHRFMKECQKAFKNKVKLIILVEGTNCKKLEDVKNWHSKFSWHDGAWLYREMKSVSIKYDVEWQFCTKNKTAKRILELINYDERRNKKFN